MQADSSRHFLRLTLKVVVGVLILLLLLFGGLLAYVVGERSKYDRLTDTRDLKQRAAKMEIGRAHV